MMILGGSIGYQSLTGLWAALGAAGLLLVSFGFGVKGLVDVVVHGLGLGFRKPFRLQWINGSPLWELKLSFLLKTQVAITAFVLATLVWLKVY